MRSRLLLGLRARIGNHTLQWTNLLACTLQRTSVRSVCPLSVTPAHMHRNCAARHQSRPRCSLLHPSLGSAVLNSLWGWETFPLQSCASSLDHSVAVHNRSCFGCVREALFFLPRSQRDSLLSSFHPSQSKHCTEMCCSRNNKQFLWISYELIQFSSCNKTAYDYSHNMTWVESDFFIISHFYLQRP